MSYDIFFVKNLGMSVEQMEDALDSESKPEDKLYINDIDREQIESELEKLGLDFEKSKYEDSLSLDFPSFQIGIFDNQIGLSIPYWEINSNPQIQKSIQSVFDTILKNGYQALDPQIGELVQESHNIAESFSANLDSVKKALDNLKPAKKWWRFW